MPVVGETRTAVCTVDPSGVDTDGVLTVFQPGGGTETPTVSGAGTGTLTAPVDYDAEGWWLLKWEVSGTGAGERYEEVYVEAAPALPSSVPLYATVEELREHFDDTIDALSDALLVRALKATSRGINDFCGRRFWQDPVVVTRTYRPEDGELAWVDDISTTTGLSIATDTNGDGTFSTTWSASDYQLQPRNANADGPAYAWWRIAAIDRYRFPTAGLRDTLQVTARFGWSAIPDEVNLACILRAAALFKRKETIDGVRGVSEFGVVRISTKRDPDVADLLHNFIKIGVGTV